MPPASRKINRSCQECTRRKVKCDGGHPCAACTHNQTAETCEYRQRSRRHAVSRRYSIVFVTYLMPHHCTDTDMDSTLLKRPGKGP